MVLGIMGNPTKPRFEQEVTAFLKILRGRGISFVYDDENPNLIEFKPGERVPHTLVGKHSDLVISFGGDGTLLRTAAAVAPHGKPILGVNLGTLGYLTDLTPRTILERLDDVLDGNFAVEERMMIEARVSGSEIVHRALNDFVIGQTEVSRTSEFDLFIDSLPASTYRADGLIIASPTGSTAYSLSAGGPLIEPTLPALIITPICPHTLTMRPLAVTSKRVISVRPRGPAVLTADGEHVFNLELGQEITVTASALTALLVNILGRDFYHVLRDKLNWGTPPAGTGNV